MTTATVEIPEAFEYLFDPPLGALRWRVAYGGRGSGKSQSMARALLVHGYERPLRILCAREFQASIKDSVHRLLSDQIDAMGLGGAYEVQQTGIFGANGTEFLFKGLRHNINEIKSTQGIDICWVEEGQAVSQVSWDLLIPTIRTDGSDRIPNTEIWVSFNPGLASDATYQLLIASERPRSIVRKVNYESNPFFPDDLRDEMELLRATDLEAYDHVWGGNPWTRTKASILADKCVVETFTPGEGWQGPYYGADWGFANDPTVVVRLWIHGGDLFIEYGQGAPLLDTDRTAELFRSIPGLPAYVVRADSARPETINEMKRRGLRVEGAPKWDGSVKDGIAHLRSYGRIVIHPRAPIAIEEAKLYRYKTDPSTGDVLPVPIDKHNHIWDAVRYALGPLIKRQGFAPVPIRFA